MLDSPAPAEYNQIIKSEEDHTMFNEYHITMDSFGQTCPANWQEIADHLNTIIDATPDITDPDTGELTAEGREQVNAIWERYCAGDMPDAPAPVFDD